MAADMDTTPALSVAVRSATSRAAALDAEKPADEVLVLTVAAGTAGIGSFENACVELLNTTAGAMANNSCANLRSLFIGTPKEMRDWEMVSLGRIIGMDRAFKRKVIA
jgi:hypothetical protein